MESSSTRLRTIFRIYAILMGLLVLTACGVLLPPSPWVAALNLSIAGAKAFLIFVFFMQLRTATGLIRVVACVGFAWLAIALCLVFADYLTRG